MPRNDPTDNGGLFIGRRPGTGPIHWRRLPEPGSLWRRRVDWCLAAVLLIVMALIIISFWGPIPLLGLWIGSQVQYLAQSPGIGLLAAFLTCVVCYLGGLWALNRMDRAWVLIRRGSGRDQRNGVLSRLMVVSSFIGVVGFSVWLIGFSGAELAPVGIRF